MKEKINVCVQEVHHLCVPRKSERERVRKRCTYCDKIIVCASKRERERDRRERLCSKGYKKQMRREREDVCERDR